jgi:hypothetical protein
MRYLVLAVANFIANLGLYAPYYYAGMPFTTAPAPICMGRS